MRFLVSIGALAILSACNGGGSPPPDAPTSGGTTSGSASSNETTAQGGTEGANATAPTASATSTTNPGANGEAPSETGSCGGRTCASGETCASYYGIAGPRGPMFHECVVRCRRGAPNDGCPDGMKCHTIADGPGDVCR